MTESEWLSELNTAQSMIEFLLKPGKMQRSRNGRRKLRLYACGCCRIIWKELDAESKRDVKVAERCADLEINKEQMYAALRENPRSIVCGNLITLEATRAQFSTFCAEWTASLCASEASKWHLPLVGQLQTRQEADATQCQLVRDIFGNPFRPVEFDRRSCTPTVVALSAAMYVNQDFSTMPILADALEDAGCENGDILNHCRSDAPHVRGCWVVDRCLGKK